MDDLEEQPVGHRHRARIGEDRAFRLWDATTGQALAVLGSQDTANPGAGLFGIKAA